MPAAHPNPGRWRRRSGAALLIAGLALIALFAASARWWVGYGTEAWIADLGDGTLYVTPPVFGSRYSRPPLGWCGGENTRYDPVARAQRPWTWTWWAWGERGNSLERGHAYSVWPLAPLCLLAGAALFYPGYRAARRRRQGRCPACGYPRAGLAPGAPCPECGAAAAPPTPPAT